MNMISVYLSTSENILENIKNPLTDIHYFHTLKPKREHLRYIRKYSRFFNEFKKIVNGADNDLKSIANSASNTFNNIVNSANNYKINLINGTCYDILPMMLPFGVNTNPTIKDLEDFINSRCIPETRFDLKQMLKFFDIPAYDPWDTVKRNHGAA